MTQQLPERDTSKPDNAQGLYAKYQVTRIDGKPEKPGADYFVLDMTHDVHARPALGAYVRSCHKEYPQLAADLEARYLGGGLKLDVPAPHPETADTFKTRDYHKRSVSYADLIGIGLADAVVRQLFDMRSGDDNTDRAMPWPRLALKDGMTALAVLSDQELAAISNELRAEGAPGIPLKTPAQIANFLWTAAEFYCGTDEWADRASQSAVAAALLVKVAQEAWRPVAILKGNA